jgi:ATPase subunit of ABC transporter with duplicated ATPase domains
VIAATLLVSAFVGITVVILLSLYIYAKERAQLMLVNIDTSIQNPSAPKLLYGGLSLSLNKGEKVGLIGRNGCGKSTLLNIINGSDKDYDGDLSLAKNITIASTRQEHSDQADKIVITYILGDIPRYTKLKRSD